MQAGESKQNKVYRSLSSHIYAIPIHGKQIIDPRLRRCQARIEEGGELGVWYNNFNEVNVSKAKCQGG